MKQSFNIEGMHLAVQKAHLTPKIIQALSSGVYENAERAAIARNVRVNDRVLDLGGGIGCTGIVAGKIVGGHNLMVVEANAELIPDLEDNLKQNNIRGAEVLNAAVVAHPDQAETTFYKAKGFWAGSLLRNERIRSERVDVTAVRLSELLSRFCASVLICDTEGLESKIFQVKLARSVRLIILELHPNLYDQDTIKSVFDELSKQGFSYVPYGSRGSVVCFTRKCNGA